MLLSHIQNKSWHFHLFLSCSYSGQLSRTQQQDSPLAHWLCDCLSNQFPLHHYDKKLSNFRALTLNMMLYNFCPLSPSVTAVLNCMLGCLRLLAQYMGFYQLSESNNWHQKWWGERERGIINPLDVSFILTGDCRRNPALSCWGDLKFQSTCIEKRL